MKRGRRSKYVVLLISLVLIFSLTGCKASKKKVLESSYYKELQKENKKLKKQNKSLKSKVDAENDMTEDEQRASDYLEKISRDHLVKLEVGYADNMDGSEFIEGEAVFSLATTIASRADKTTKYTPVTRLQAEAWMPNISFMMKIMLFMKSWYMAVITLCLLICRTMFIMPIMLPLSAMHFYISEMAIQTPNYSIA